MSIFDIFGKIVSLVGKVAGVVSVVVKIARPIVEALRPAVAEVDAALDWLEETAIKAGEEADDVLDRNMPTVNAIEEIAGRGVVVFAGLERVAVMCRQFSQEQTPDAITDDEAAALIAEIKATREALQAWGPALDKALEKMKEVE